MKFLGNRHCVATVVILLWICGITLWLMYSLPEQSPKQWIFVNDLRSDTVVDGGGDDGYYNDDAEAADEDEPAAAPAAAAVTVAIAALDSSYKDSDYDDTLEHPSPQADRNSNHKEFQANDFIDNDDSKHIQELFSNAIRSTVDDIVRYKSDRNVNRKIHPELRASFGAIERRFFTWRQQNSPLHAIAVGQSSIIRRDYPTLKKAYSSSEFTSIQKASEVSRLIEIGRMDANLRGIRRAVYDILLCLSLDTSKCLNDPDFQRLSKEKKLVNQLLGLKDVLWSKGKFCDTLKNSVGLEWMTVFTFPCWVLPRDDDSFFTAATTPSNLHKSWISKPLKMGGGKGISVIDGYEEYKQMHLKKSQVIQPYLGNPHLIRGKKWDLRTYILISNAVPMRAYMYSNGIVRFASEKYDANAAKGGKKTQFLTNTSINKDKAYNMSLITWSFQQLEQHFDGVGADVYSNLISNMKRAVGLMLVAAEKAFSETFTSGGGKRYNCNNCFHLLGVDLIVDSNLNTKVIEVNGEPSMKLSGDSASDYDSTKLSMQTDLNRLLFNTNRVAGEVLKQLKTICSFDDGVDSGLEEEEACFEWLLSEKHALAYIVNLLREATEMGGFYRVYPPLALSRAETELWDAFLKRSDASDSRRRLHRLLVRLEYLRYSKCKLEKDTSYCSLDLLQLKDANSKD